MNPYTEQVLSFFWSEEPLGQAIILIIAALMGLSLLTALFHIYRYSSLETGHLKTVQGRVRRRNEEQQAGVAVAEETEVDESDEDENALEEANDGAEVENELEEADESAEVENETSEQTEEAENSAPQPSEGQQDNELDERPDSEAELQTMGQLLIEPNELKQGISSRSIIGQRLDSLAKMRASQVKVNINALQQMSIAREMPKLGLGIPGFVVGIAMMLGMLGTFIGLTMMVRDIDLRLPAGYEEITLDTWVKSIQNIRNVLNGMKTAFSTTLVGLVCAIFSAGLNFLLGHAQSGFFEKLERFTTEELLPKTVPAVEDETLLEKVSLQLETSFERLEEISTQNTQTLEDLNAIENAFLKIVSQIQEGTRRAASNNLEGVVSELTKVNHSISTVTGGLPETLRLMQKHNQKMLEGVTRLVRANQEDLNRYVRTRPIQIPLPSTFQTVLVFIMLILFIIAVYGVWPYIFPR